MQGLSSGHGTLCTTCYTHANDDFGSKKTCMVQIFVSVTNELIHTHFIYVYAYHRQG